jgi:hypothetical protein
MQVLEFCSQALVTVETGGWLLILTVVCGLFAASWSEKDISNTAAVKGTCNDNPVPFTELVIAKET